MDTFEEEEDIDIQATQIEIERIKIELVDAEKQMAVYLKELGF